MANTCRNMKPLIPLLFSVLVSLYGYGQTKKIDQLFTAWTSKNPGGVVLISHKNSIVYFKTYGLENLNYQIPISKASVFNIGSVSKQFTAMGILLLEQAGKLSLDDDITLYLPDLGNPGQKITIRNLLHHTSGIRSTPEIFGLAGWRDGDAIYNEDVLRMLKQQRSLNFSPNSEFMYSNSNYVLLAHIIQVITKQEFKEWMQENVFSPLGMHNTFIQEDYKRITKKVTSSYLPVAENGFKYSENFDQTFGASNVYSTANDLLKWNMNFSHPHPDWKKVFEKMCTLDVLNSGRPNNYAFGVIVDDFFGNRRIQHTGGIAGFQALLYSYPAEDLNIIILSNFQSMQLTKIADRISQLFLPMNTIPAATALEIKTIKMDEAQQRKLEGHYWNEKQNYSRSIQFVNDTLWYIRNESSKSPLLPIGENVFQMKGVSEQITLRYDFATETLELAAGNQVPELFTKYEKRALDLEELRAYSGTFYNRELDVYYTIYLQNNQLWGHHSRFGDFEIQVLKKDVLNWSGAAISKSVRNENKQIVGLKMDINRVKNVYFEKVVRD